MELPVGGKTSSFLIFFICFLYFAGKSTTTDFFFFTSKTSAECVITSNAHDSREEDHMLLDWPIREAPAFELPAPDGRSLLRSLLAPSLDTRSHTTSKTSFQASSSDLYQPTKMSKKQIYYSDKYNDEDFEYRYKWRLGVFADINVLEECQPSTKARFGQL